MATAARISHDLLNCDGFRIESSSGPVGSVEEVWLGQAGEPQAIAVRTVDGRRGLLLAADVAAVHPEYRWIVVEPETRLLELEPPRLAPEAVGAPLRLAASWATTGATLPVASRTTALPRLAFRFRRKGSERAAPERPLWKTIALLYGSIVVVVSVIMTLSFVIAHLAA